MPVINLPRDDRFGDLGKGLGGLASGLVQGAAQQQTQAAVSQIMSDPNISEQDKPVQILKDHGDAGYQLYKNLLSSQAIQAGIKEKLAQVGLTTVETAAKQAQMDKLFPEQVAKTKAETARLGAETTKDLTLLPGQVTQQAAQAGQTVAQTGNIQSEEATRRALLPGQLTQQGAGTEHTRAQTTQLGVESGLGAASLPSVIAKGEVAKLQLEQLRGTMNDTGAATSLDKILTDSGIKPDSPLGNTAKSAYKMEPDINKKGDAFIKVISGQSQAEARAQIPGEAPGDIRKSTGNSVEAATSSLRFLEGFRKGGAESIGTIADLLQGKEPAAVKIALERRGFPSGDQTTVDMWNASIQQIASTATSGGGFFAEGRVRLAKDVTPSLSESPLHALLAADQVADRSIALLNNQKLSLAPKQSKAGIDDALNKWKEVKAVTGSLNSYVVNPGKPDERTVMMFDGNQIDPKSFKKLVEGGKTYEFKGASMSGAALIDEARKRNVAPDVFREQLKKHFENVR